MVCVQDRQFVLGMRLEVQVYPFILHEPGCKVRYSYSNSEGVLMESNVCCLSGHEIFIVLSKWVVEQQGY